MCNKTKLMLASMVLLALMPSMAAAAEPEPATILSGPRSGQTLPLPAELTAQSEQLAVLLPGELLLELEPGASVRAGATGGSGAPLVTQEQGSMRTTTTRSTSLVLPISTTSEVLSGGESAADAGQIVQRQVAWKTFSLEPGCEVVVELTSSWRDVTVVRGGLEVDGVRITAGQTLKLSTGRIVAAGKVPPPHALSLGPLGMEVDRPASGELAELLPGVVAGEESELTGGGEVEGTQSTCLESSGSVTEGGTVEPPEPEIPPGQTRLKVRFSFPEER